MAIYNDYQLSMGVLTPKTHGNIEGVKSSTESLADKYFETFPTTTNCAHVVAFILVVAGGSNNLHRSKHPKTP